MSNDLHPPAALGQSRGWKWVVWMRAASGLVAAFGAITAFAAPAAAAAAAAMAGSPSTGTGWEGDYTRDLKPLFQERCYACHGALKQKAGLRLDTVEAMKRGGDSGPALVPGRPEKSPVLGRASATESKDRMPPEHEGSALNAAQLEQVRRWIAAGAPSPADERPESDPREHWAFRPHQRPIVPSGYRGTGFWFRLSVPGMRRRGQVFWSGGAGGRLQGDRLLDLLPSLVPNRNKGRPDAAFVPFRPALPVHPVDPVESNRGTDIWLPFWRGWPFDRLG